MEYIRNNDPKFVTVSTVSEVVGYWNSNKNDKQATAERQGE